MSFDSSASTTPSLFANELVQAKDFYESGHSYNLALRERNAMRVDPQLPQNPAMVIPYIAWAEAMVQERDVLAATFWKQALRSGNITRNHQDQHVECLPKERQEEWRGQVYSLLESIRQAI